ncbi:MAG: hypothetical protein P4N24_00355, partial [Acidobacteriota bacterium]|nr:hypothetical protein [Acidobacteriota bacterium]
MAAGKKGGKFRLNSFKLLKMHIEKMPVFRLSMIFMKTNELNHSFHDVDEKIGSYAKSDTVTGARGDVEPPGIGFRPLTLRGRHEGATFELPHGRPLPISNPSSTAPFRGNFSSIWQIIDGRVICCGTHCKS